MNVLHLQTELNITCGVSKTIFLIANNLKDEVNHYIITLNGDGIERFKKNNLKVEVLKYNRKYFLDNLFLFQSLYHYCRKNKIDLIHSHHRYFDLIAFLLSKLLHIPSLLTVQSKVYGFKNLSYKSNYFIAVSETIKNHLINHFGIAPEKICVINNFVDPCEVKITTDKEDIKHSLHFPKSKFIIGFIGRSSIAEKGVDILLKAFEKLSGENKEICLLMVGKGEDDNYIKKYIADKCLPAVLLPPEYNIYQYINLCDMLILPSRIDPFPLTMLEAGLMKKPFIGSNVDGIAEFIDNEVNGLLFQPENIEELVLCMKKMINDHNSANKMANALFNKVINGYTAEKIIPEYKKIYYKLLNAYK